MRSDGLLTMSENETRRDDTFTNLLYTQLFNTSFAFKLLPSVRVNVHCQAADSCLKEVEELRHSAPETVPVWSRPLFQEPVFISRKPKLPHRTQSESLNVYCIRNKKNSDRRALTESKLVPANISVAIANRHRYHVLQSSSIMTRQLSNCCTATAAASTGGSLLVWTSSLDIFVPSVWFGVQKRLLISTTAPSFPVVEYPYASFLLACCQYRRSVGNCTAASMSVPCSNKSRTSSMSDPCSHRSAVVNSSSLNAKTISTCVQPNAANLIVPCDRISHQSTPSTELGMSKRVQPEMEQFSEGNQSDYCYCNSSSTEIVLSSTNNSAAMNVIDSNNITDCFERHVPSVAVRDIVNSSLGSQVAVYVPQFTQLDIPKEGFSVGLGMLPDCDSCYESVDSGELMMFAGIENKLDEQTSEFSEDSEEEEIMEEQDERKASVGKVMWEVEEEGKDGDEEEEEEGEEEWQKEEAEWENEEKAEVEVEENDETEDVEENEDVKEEVLSEEDEDGEEADESSCGDDTENESDEWTDDDDRVPSSIKEQNCCTEKEQTKSSFFVRASDCDSDSSDSSHSETSDDDSNNDDDDDDDDDYDNDDWEVSSSSPALTCLEDLDPFQINGLYIPPASTIPVGRPSCTSKSPEEPESAAAVALKHINDCWNEHYDRSVPSKPRSKSSAAEKKPKKVDFVAGQPIVIPVLNDELWEEDYMSARCGCWEQLARDHGRFQNRIREVEKEISFVFSTSHRAEVFRRLYASHDQEL